MYFSPMTVPPRAESELEHPAVTIDWDCRKGPGPATETNSPKTTWRGND
jgi:hypothetical protein